MRIELIARNHAASGLQRRCDFAAPPALNQASQLFLGKLLLMGGEYNGGENPAAQRGNGMFTGPLLQALRQLCDKRLGLSRREQILAPVENHGDLSQVGGGAECPSDRGPAGGIVLGDFIVKRAGKSRLRHGSVPGHQELELLPARRSAVALLTQQLQAVRTQQEPRMLGVDPVAFVRRRGLSLHDEADEKKGKGDLKSPGGHELPIVSYGYTGWPHCLASPPRSGFRPEQNQCVTAIDSWPRGCYSFDELAK